MTLQKTDIEQMEMLLIDGIRSSNIPFLDATIHDDLLCLAPDGKTITKAMDLASHKAGEMVVDQLTATMEDIRIIGDTAVATIYYDTKGKMLGHPIEGRFKYIRVWKKFDDGLKVIAASCMKI